MPQTCLEGDDEQPFTATMKTSNSQREQLAIRAIAPACARCFFGSTTRATIAETVERDARCSIRFIQRVRDRTLTTSYRRIVPSWDVAHVAARRELHRLNDRGEGVRAVRPA